MKNHRFLWLRNRTTNNRKCEKARNIKEKRTIEMFNTVSKQLVALRSSARDNRLLRLYQNGSKTPENQGFPGFSYWLRKPPAMPVEVSRKKALASSIEGSESRITIQKIRMHTIKTADVRLRAAEQ